MRLSFIKMEAAGNDYIYVDAVSRRTPVVDWSMLARILSDRHRGVGSDGLILIQPSEAEDFRMRMFNADGSEGDMCGNGVRCLAGYVWDNGLVGSPSFSVATRSGPVQIQICRSEGFIEVEASMPPPEFTRGEVPMRGDAGAIAEAVDVNLNGCTIPVHGVRIGNPHCVIFVKDPRSVDVAALGPLFESHSMFPERTNVEFVQVIDEHNIRMRVWERGSGLTQACGTGACASAVWAIRLGHCNSPVNVHMAGGDVDVSWDGGEDLKLRGAVRETFRGTVAVPSRAQLHSDEITFQSGPGAGLSP